MLREARKYEMYAEIRAEILKKNACILQKNAKQSMNMQDS